MLDMPDFMSYAMLSETEREKSERHERLITAKRWWRRVITMLDA